MGKAKKVIDFIAMRPALTTRNMTSIGLVVLLFVTYILAGGRVTSIPTVEAAKGFGGAHTKPPKQASRDSLTGDIRPTQSRAVRQPRNSYDSYRTAPRAESVATTTAPRRPERSAAATHKPSDHHSSLSDLQKRLNRIGSHEDQ